MFFSSGYMLIAILGFVLVLVPQLLVKSAYSKFSNIDASSGMTGAQVAKSILSNKGINNVDVEPVQGTLSDHYDPTSKVVRLSEDIYYGKSIAAYGVAAHEVGHAIQDAENYMPMRARASIFPVVNFGQGVGPILIMASIGLRAFLNLGGLTDLIALLGILFYAAVVVFHIVTLPVEFNASFRALKALESGNYLDSKELNGSKNVLTAAALTYVAAALYAIIELIYWIWVLFNNRNND